MPRLSILLALLPLAMGLGCDPPAAAVDAGPDAGAPSSDAGPLFFDAGPGDAGVQGDDAGPARDGGASADAGPLAADAGPDAGPAGSRIDALLTRLSAPGATAAELDALMVEVRWGEGWPVREGARWLFATRWDGAPSGVALVGQINTWATTAAPATQAASGVHYFVVVEEASFDVPAAGALYKWFGAPDVYRAPPEATAYGADANGGFGYVAPPTDRRWRERFAAFESSHLGDARTFRALLPAGFTRGSSARVLFLHDGQNVFDEGAPWGGWRVHEALDADSAYDDVVVLAVDNAPDRFDAYTQVVDSLGGSIGTVGGRAEDYLMLVEDEALPFFRARYGLAASGDSLVIGGSSLGGLVTLYGAMTRPTLAGCVIAMSSTLGWGAFGSNSAPEALVNRWVGRLDVAIYLDSGGSGTCLDTDMDGVQEDSSHTDNYCTTGQMRDHLVAQGYAFDVDLFHWHEPGALHNEGEWAARLPRALASCATAGWTAASP